MTAAPRSRAAWFAAVVAVVALWPLAHPFVIARLDADPWKLGGFAMYTSYQTSLALNRGSISAWNNLALALEGAGRGDDAVQIWQQILAWAEQRDAERYRERAARRLRELGAAPAPRAP